MKMRKKQKRTKEIKTVLLHVKLDKEKIEEIL